MAATAASPRRRSRAKSSTPGCWGRRRTGTATPGTGTPGSLGRPAHEHHPGLAVRPVAALYPHRGLDAAGRTVRADGHRTGGAAQRQRTEHGHGDGPGRPLRRGARGHVAALAGHAAAPARGHPGVLCAVDPAAGAGAVPGHRPPWTALAEPGRVLFPARRADEAEPADDGGVVPQPRRPPAAHWSGTGV